MPMQKQELPCWLWLCVLELHHPSVVVSVQDPSSSPPAAGQVQPLALGTVTGVTHPEPSVLLWEEIPFCFPLCKPLPLCSWCWRVLKVTKSIFLLRKHRN